MVHRVPGGMAEQYAGGQEVPKENEKAPKVVSVWNPAGMDACALYRMYIPHLNIRRSRFIFNPQRLPVAYLAQGDVLVVQRQGTEGNYIALKYLKEQLGLKLVYDLDDNIWNVPRYNPARPFFERFKNGFGVCAQLCDVLTVSTQSLKSAVRSALPDLRNKEILVVPNAIDFRLFRSCEKRKDGKIIIGWSGSNTHTDDVEMVWNLLPELLDEFENVYVHIVGAEPSGKLVGHPKVRHTPWVQTGEYPARLSTWAWDIFVAPLEDNKFNRSKSAIKLMEAAATGAAGIGTDVQPYREFYAFDDYLVKNGLCLTRYQWKEKLTKLIKDEAHRNEMVSRAQRITRTWFNIEKIKNNWIHALESVC